MANQKQKEKKKKQNKTLLIVASLLALVLIALLVITQLQKGSASASAAENAGAVVDAENAETPLASHIAEITVRDYGTITAELYENIAPETVENFVNLAGSGFYDGLTFHRIMDGFMIQGGDPLGTGMGGSEETITGEFNSNGHTNPLSHVRGLLSMARSQDPDSASSQFFIVQSDSTFLDGEYAGFGMVTEGMDVVDQIAKDAEPTDDNGTIPAENQPVIESITVRTA